MTSCGGVSNYIAPVLQGVLVHCGEEDELVRAVRDSGASETAASQRARW